LVNLLIFIVILGEKDKRSKADKEQADKEQTENISNMPDTIRIDEMKSKL